MAREAIRYLRLSAAADHALWRGVRQLCCETGNDGAAIALERWQFFAEVWIAPYQRIIPHWSYAALNNGRVVGYLTGCPDTRKFLRQKWLLCDLPQAVRLSAKIARLTGPERNFLKRAAGLTKGPEQRFAAKLRHDLLREYPAHLHMNVAADYRRQGIGRQLTAQYIDDLHQANVGGVHLYCGARPRDFYLGVGFRELGTIRYAGIAVYALALKW